MHKKILWICLVLLLLFLTSCGEKSSNPQDLFQLAKDEELLKKVVETSDFSLCREIKSDSLKMKCDEYALTKNKNRERCNNLESPRFQEKCNLEIDNEIQTEALLNGDFDKCNEINYDDLRYSCQYAVTIALESTDKCTQLYSDYQDNCNAMLGQWDSFCNENKLQICGLTTAKNARDDVLYNLFKRSLRFKNISQCNEVINEKMRDSCYIRILHIMVLEKWDTAPVDNFDVSLSEDLISYKDSIMDSEMKDLFISELAGYAGQPKFCELIANTKLKKECEEDNITQ